MDGLLSEISTTRQTGSASARTIPRASSITQETVQDDLKSLSDVTLVLRGQPSLKALRAGLNFINNSEDLSQSIKLPSAGTTPFLAALINNILPNYWSQIVEKEDQLCAIITSILRSVPGLVAILARLKVLMTESQTGVQIAKADSLWENITCLVQVSERVLLSSDSLLQLWLDLDGLGNSSQRSVLRSELVTLLAGGRVSSIVSQAQDVARTLSESQVLSWLGNGKEYSAWLGESCAVLAGRLVEPTTPLDKSYSQLVGRAMNFGYREAFVVAFISHCTNENSQSLPLVTKVIASLRLHEQKSFFLALLRKADNALDSTAVTNDEQVQRTNNLAAFLGSLCSNNDNISEFLQAILTRIENNNWMPSLELRKAAVLAFAHDQTELDKILNGASEKFADDLFVAHAPIIHQELVTQTLLATAGLVHRARPARLRQLAKSSRHISAISMHLKSNSTRIRWLGMLVGSAISSLVDDGENKLKFDDESLTTTEAKKFLALLQLKQADPSKVDFRLLFASTIDGISSKPVARSFTLPARPKNEVTRTVAKPKIDAALKITELPDEDGIVPYAKPDSDPEDEEEDPTLVNRDKPKPPVYIRDLLVGLRESEKYDKHRMALMTASSLIRRKSGFGTEVKDHIQELGSVLMNLNNSFDFEDFVELREKALIAVLIADPVPVAQYYAKCAFEGDFSIQQRVSLLAALGLAARELAAFKDNEHKQTSQFPTKELPDHLKRIYGEQSTALDRVAVRVQRSVTEPLALKAADAITGPNALKVRTFSSRIAKEKTRKRPAANELAKIVGEAFFFPLTARWWMQARSSGRNASAFASPILMPVYIRTLAIIMHAAGSWALALPQMTTEFWSILLSTRGAALGAKEYQILGAILFGAIMILDINGENSEGIARERSNELLETQEWCKLVLDQIPGGDDESDQVRSLAASVIIRCQEVIERWQRLMVGNMIDL